jgi:hypothetical protein
MQTDTARADKEAFLRRLRSQPAFLLRHVPALTGAVGRRLTTRLMIRLAGTLRGRKTRPEWLNAGTSAFFPVAERGLMLPAYACGATGGGAAVRADSPRSSDPVDPEDYLTDQRWGFLTESLLAGTLDRGAQLAQCLEWVERHDDRTDPAWEPYSACERVANLLVSLAVMRAVRQAPDIPPRLRTFLQDSLGWILQHLEYYGPDATNNHIINNARAVVLAAVALRERAALSAGMQIFRRCLPRLILPGGFLRERSSHYQAIVLNWVLDAWWFLGVAGQDSVAADREFLDEYAERMVGATALLCGRGARLLALIGDVSPDLSPVQSLARLGLLYPDRWPRPWQAGARARLQDGWFRIDSHESVVLGNFPAGSFPARFPTHGHADFTSFAWLYGECELLVDRGRYRYTPDAVSASQACASGHNLPTVNGFAPLCESLVPGGRWWPLPYAAARLQAAAVDAQVELAHDGFARATPVGWHIRRLALERRALVVLDSFEGVGSVELSFWWHFGGGFDNFDAQRMAVTGPGAHLDLNVEGVAGAARVGVVPGASERGWISRIYGERQPGLGLCLSWQVGLPARVTTRFALRIT